MKCGEEDGRGEPIDHHEMKSTIGDKEVFEYQVGDEFFDEEQ